MNEVKILCTVIKVNEDTDNLKKGDYLEVTVGGKNNKRIKYEEFVDKVRLLRQTKGEPSHTPAEGLSTDIDQSVDLEVVTPDYRSLLTFILSGVEIKSLAVDNVDLIIISDLNIILELPWEKIFQTANIFRKYNSNKVEKHDLVNSNDLVILMSHAHEGVGYDLKPVMDQEIRSIYDALHILKENNQQSFRINRILLAKHTTKKIISEIDWGLYNFLHVICHGDSDGDLVFERDHQMFYRHPDIMKKQDFLSIINKGTFKLIYLSICNSAGGSTVDESIAYKLISSGIAEYCIAYREGIGENSASKFASIFYSRLLQGKKIQETYKDSMVEFKKINSKKYLPYLYIS